MVVVSAGSARWSVKIIKNSYPQSIAAPHALPGDIVHWEAGPTFCLVRDSDGKVVFSTAPVDRDGRLRSNGKTPVLTGVVAEIKKRGWVLEIE